MPVSHWYFRSWESFYFDMLYKGSKLQRFKITIKPDLSDASLHVINMPEIIPVGLLGSLLYRSCTEYRICEDALVCFSTRIDRKGSRWGAYVGLTSAPFTNVVTGMRWNGDIDSLCPASGRFVYCTDDGNRGLFHRIVVVDLF